MATGNMCKNLGKFGMWFPRYASGRKTEIRHWLEFNCWSGHTNCCTDIKFACCEMNSLGSQVWLLSGNTIIKPQFFIDHQAHPRTQTTG